MLRHVVKSIHEHEETDKEMDVETFQRLVLTARYGSSTVISQKADTQKPETS